MDANGLVAPVLRRIAIGGQEPSFGLPAGLPVRLGQFDVDMVKAMAELGQPVATSTHRYSSGTQPVLNRGQLGFQMLQPTLLGVSLRLGCVTIYSALLAPNGNCKPRADGVNGATQPNAVVDQVGQSPLPLLVGCAGYGPCPAARGLACRCALAQRPLVVAPSQPTPPGKIVAGKTTEMRAHHPKHGFVGGGQPQSGSHPGACRQANHEGVGNRTHVPEVTGRERQDVESVPNSARLLPYLGTDPCHTTTRRASLWHPQRERRRRRNEVSK
jgi:hypothetical protein